MEDTPKKDTVERMPRRYETDPTLTGYNESSAQLTDDVANGALDVKQAQAANAAVKNGIAAVKTQLSLIKDIRTMNDDSLVRFAADLIGGPQGERFHDAVIAGNRQRQISTDRKPAPENDKPTEG